MTKRRGRGEGGIYKRIDGSWCAQIALGHDANGARRRRTVYAKTRAELQKKLFDLQTAVAAGALNEPKRMRLSTYLTRWLEDAIRSTVRESTFVRYESLINNHMIPGIGGIQLSGFQPSHVQNLYRTLEKDGASPRTREMVHLVLRQALKQAVKWGYVIRNVCDVVSKPRAPKKVMKFWSEEEANAFLSVAKEDRFYALYILALTTGMHQGELFGLRWEDVDLNQSSIAICRTVSELRGKSVNGEPKTAKGRRRIELPNFSTEALRNHRVRMLAEGHPGGWVFCDSEGGVLRRSNFRKRSYIPLLLRSGLPEIRFHDLRHTAATLLLSQGVHPKIVQERLGHAQVSITLDTYSHVLPSMQKEAASKLDALFSAAKQK